MTFSQSSAFAIGFAASTVSSASPAVRVFWLWQLMQYLSRTARGAAAAGELACEAAGVGPTWRADVETVDRAMTRQHPLREIAKIPARLTPGIQPPERPVEGYPVSFKYSALTPLTDI